MLSTFGDLRIGFQGMTLQSSIRFYAAGISQKIK